MKDKSLKDKFEEISQRPGIKEIIEPNLKNVPQYRQDQERYRRLYRHLEEDFSE
jgi:sugar (pentulose or hexulose) kinase